MQEKNSRLPLLVAVLALAVGISFIGTTTLAPRAEAREQKADVQLLRRIVDRRDETWRWQQLMGRPRTPHAATASRSQSPTYRRWVFRLWASRAARASKQAKNPPHKTAWLCIHRYEGGWDDPNAPYYGGLQMDMTFQHTYGPELLRAKGTADNWTPLEQMWVAERAHRSRGFHPWPNTARFCGLL